MTFSLRRHKPRHRKPWRQTLLEHIWRDSGSSAVEYGLMVAAIAATIVGVVFALGTVVSTAFSNTSTQIGSCVPDPATCNRPPAPPVDPNAP